MAKSKTVLIFILATVIFKELCLKTVRGQGRHGSRTCPEGCLCFITTVRCMHLGLESVPTVTAETRILDLRFNRIRNIPSSTFQGMRNLNTLLLNNNHIREISEDAFQGLSSLKYLYLYKNKIQTVHKRAFEGLVSLEQLYLHDNEIRTLHPMTFSNLPKLERLFLHSNKLRMLPNKLFSNLNSLKRLRLDGNRLQCNCHLLWLAIMLRESRNKIQAAATCFEPRRLAGRSVSSVSANDLICEHSVGPKITLHPTNTVTFQGQSTRLMCRVRGSPQPEISWEHDGHSVNTNNRVRIMNDGTLFIEATRESDQGSYKCIAENRQGLVESDVAMLDYIGSEGSPVFLVIPESKVVSVGERVTFHCRATGNPKPVTRWYRNNQRLQPDSNFIILKETLHIRETNLDDNGVYTCVAANSLGSANSNASLTVQKSPVFTTTPSPQTVAQGDSATFDCQAEGVPTPVITWLRNGEPLNRDRDQRYLVMSSGALLIRAVNPDDEGTYICQAESSTGRIVTNSSLTVIIRPHFLIRPQNQRVSQGNNVDFQCQLAGRPPPHIVWTINGRAIPDDDRYNLLPSGTLRLLQVQPSDAGRFRCDGANPYGEQHAEVTLTVIDRIPFTFIRRPVDQLVESGTDVKLTCQVRGGQNDRRSEIFWSKDGVRFVATNGRYSITPAPTSELTIYSVGRDDSGRYECFARSGIDVISSSMTLVVRIKNSIGEIVEKLSTLLPPNCLRHGCSDELIDDKESQNLTSNEQLNDIFHRHLVHNRERNKRQSSSGFPNVVSLSDLEETVRNAEQEVDRGINGTIQYLNDGRNRQTSGDLLALMRFPSSQEGIDMSRAAEIFDVSLRMIECCVKRGMRLRKFNIRSSQREEFDTNDIQTSISNDVQMTAVVDRELVELVANLSGCTTYQPAPDCTRNICFHRKYRTPDGTCNNIQHPLWGASRTPFHRLLQPIYENGFNAPIGWNPDKKYNNHTLPSPRSVSVSVLMSAGSRPPRHDPDFTHMVMQWGQFLDHDLDFTTMAPSIQRFSDGLACRETCDKGAPCFPISVDRTDSRHGRFHHHNQVRDRDQSHNPNSNSCMEFTRSSAICGSGITSVFFSAISRREQINEITSYLDASNVYSSTERGMENLRDLSNDKGLLKEGQSLEIGQMPLLPYNVYSDLDSGTPHIRQVAPIECRRGDGESAQQRGVPCFLAGDLRANEQVGLTAMHTIWMREHNRIARYLGDVNPHWDGDIIFHEARKIVGAQMQHITYAAWMPKLLGPFMIKLKSYSGYDPNIPASIVNVFATAAYRFGHSMINPIMYRLNKTWEEDNRGHLMLHEAFFAPFRIVHEGGVDPLIRGLIAKPMKARDSESSMNAELIERLFSMAEEVALDLGALNIQRGRDHALPFYNDWREYCNLSRAESFDDLAGEIQNSEVRNKLQVLYKLPSNIDPFVGMILEDVVPGSRLGPTLGCILTEQFARVRDGDRFWYENPGVFTPAELNSIKQTSLSRVICDNTDSIKTLPRDVFIIQSTSAFVSCDELPSIDLSAWIDCCEECSSSGSFETTSSYGPVGSRKKRSNQMYNKPKLISALFNASSELHHQSPMEAFETEENELNYKNKEFQAGTVDPKFSASVEYLNNIIQSLTEKVNQLQHEVDELKKEKNKLLI